MIVKIVKWDDSTVLLSYNTTERDAPMIPNRGDFITLEVRDEELDDPMQQQTFKVERREWVSRPPYADVAEVIIYCE
jgi:hypothetical protein